jgi:hypothetical protein
LLDDYAVTWLDYLRTIRASGESAFPYPVFPEPGGVLPWGDIRSPGLAFWLTDSGDPDKWPVIAATDNGSYWDLFDGSACEFLLEVAAGRYDASGFRDAFRENGSRWILLSSRPVFTPFPAPAPASAPAPPMPSSEFWPAQAAGFSRWPPVNEMAWVREQIGDPPTGIPDVDWDQVHAQLGFRLPADYRAFIDSYGPGTFGDIRIMAPGQPDEWDLLALLNRRHEQGTILPLFPEPGGAISWGETADGHTLSWVPAGADPDGWLVVVIGPGAGLPDFNMRGGRSFSAALREHIEQETLLLPRDPSTPVRPVTFIPRLGR